jgi:hypothetical protein
MRSLQRRALARLLAAAAVGGLLTLLAWHLGTVAAVALLFVALTAVAFAVLTVAPDAIALRRRHPWRWWWRASPEDGPFWPGTRIPRRPRRPR